MNAGTEARKCMKIIPNACYLAGLCRPEALCKFQFQFFHSCNFRSVYTNPKHENFAFTTIYFNVQFMIYKSLHNASHTNLTLCIATKGGTTKMAFFIYFEDQQLLPGAPFTNFNDDGVRQRFIFYTPKNQNFRICLPKKNLFTTFFSIPKKIP